jgi:6-pyruvoyltetrahydropterin/6-carboxytetrahydropterin synthase
VYETGAATTFRAWHVMAGMPPPEGEPHQHDYRVQVAIQCAVLDERGMVVDLDPLTSALTEVADRARDADLDRLCPQHAGAVTVERFAQWVHTELAPALTHLRPGLILRVRVWETPDAFGGYSAAMAPA